MKTYSIEAIALLLNVNNETVRRWVRSGKLKARMVSKKSGYVIEEQDLKEFLNNSKKNKSKCSYGEDLHTERLISELKRLIQERNALNEAIARIKALLEEG
jgi:excisionase family DNA binding protein